MYSYNIKTDLITFVDLKDERRDRYPIEKKLWICSENRDKNYSRIEENLEHE